MPNPDEILKAEQTIQAIASELKRMRDAANLLQASQSQVEAVVTSAQRLIEATDRFSSESGTIITKLASMDISQKLDSLQSLHTELKSVETELTEKLVALQAQLDEFKEQQASVNRRGKILQYTTMVFGVSTLILVGVIFLKMLGLL